jgi:hypothetical protein
MNNFGIIKTKLEKASTELFGKKNFSNFMRDFKTNILDFIGFTGYFYCISVDQMCNSIVYRQEKTFQSYESS